MRKEHSTASKNDEMGVYSQSVTKCKQEMNYQPDRSESKGENIVSKCLNNGLVGSGLSQFE